METLSREEKDAIERLVDSSGWKVLMTRILLPKLHAISNRLDIATRDDFLEWKGKKAALRDIVTETYAQVDAKSPFDTHAEALLTMIRYSLEPEKEEKKDESQDYDALIRRYAQGSRPLI